jgi:protein ImuB
MACVDLPVFPLQLLLKRHPEWRDLAAAVVDEDRPQGVLLWVNERARAGRVLPGMRYAGALSLARDLRAGVISAAEINTEIEALTKRLRFFSPEVERARDEPGTFWLGAAGLGLLHPEFPGWAELIRKDLRQAGYDGRVAVGFSRFGCYAAARSGVEIAVFGDPEEERAAVRRIPIDRIACAVDVRDTLARLGIFELGGFLDLPPSGIRRRFGEAAFALHRRARGEAWAPLSPEIPEEPHERNIILDHPETDSARLLHAIEGDLGALLQRLGERDRALCGLAVEITFDRPGPPNGGTASFEGTSPFEGTAPFEGTPPFEGTAPFEGTPDGPPRRLETLRPATPTRDIGLLLDLLRLRLESIAFPSGAVDVRLEAEFVGTSPEQTALFPEQHRRDLAAANRALARVRAEFGDGAICAARLVEAHLPEAMVALEPIVRLGRAQPRKVRTAPVVRRILLQPEPIVLCPARMPTRTTDRVPMRATAQASACTPARNTAANPAQAVALAPGPTQAAAWEPAATRASGDHPAGMILRGIGLMAEAAGPFVVSGGWWRREVVRHYWYVRVVRTSTGGDPPQGARRAGADSGPVAKNASLPGTWLWIYRDARRRRWFLQGVVE